MKKFRRFEEWGLQTGPRGELMIGNHGTVGLARRFGTPLHVVNERRLLRTAAQFVRAAESIYPGRVSVHYAMKCNSVPAVVDAILHAGMNVEVMTGYELTLALRLGCPSEGIVVNGPCKTDEFLRGCIDAGVRLIVADSIEELRVIDGIAGRLGRVVDVLLRVNPDYTPHGMSSGTATASRRGCAFGLDLKGGEIPIALSLLQELTHVRFLGFHVHIGTGIRRPSDYASALRRMSCLEGLTTQHGQRIRVLDVGGGFATPSSREFGAKEILLYRAFGILPDGNRDGNGVAPEEFLRAITAGVREHFSSAGLPELILEPGRSITSASQFLLLTIHRVKERAGVGRWLVADGGLSTVTLPTFYEYHEVFLCNDVLRPRVQRATIIGPACFAGDVVYKGKLMPAVSPGEVIALMDSGAYFTAMESSFGFPRPAIVAVNGATCRLVRTRESFEEMIGRDIVD